MTERNKDWFWPWVLGAAILLVVGGIGFYLLRGRRAGARAVVDTPQPVVDTPAPPPPAVVDTAPPPARTLPLPPLDESDPDVLGGLTELFGQDAVDAARRARAHRAQHRRHDRQRAAAADGAESAADRSRRPATSSRRAKRTRSCSRPRTIARYEPFVALVSNIDAKTLVSFYRGLEPLFQQAYEELGHPDASFNDAPDRGHRASAADADAARRDRARAAERALSSYADERLEKLSAGQKLLIRMGVDNATVIKGKLREIQAELL